MVELDEFLTNEPAIWIGTNPPFDMKALNLLGSDNFRASGVQHGNYKCVWLYEILLSDVYAWKILIDESIRLLNQNGIIIVRTEENKNVNILKLKSFFFRHALLENIEVVYESSNKLPNHNPLAKEERELTIAFKVKRKNFSIYQDKSWTFAVLTQGHKVENVIKFCESVRGLEEQSCSEIIILGPGNQEYDPFNVTYLKNIYNDEFANISQKKNDIIKHAKHQNIMIVHDRFILNNDFFVGFESYGYDFNFVTIRQNYISGEVYPSYLRLKYQMWWSKITYFENDVFFDDRVFINGGLIILKKDTFHKDIFNELIFWDQGEDVELSNTLINNSVLPRMNRFSSAKTIGIDPEYTSTITFEEQLSNDISSAVNNTFSMRTLNKIVYFIKPFIPLKLKKILKAAIS